MARTKAAPTSSNTLKLHDAAVETEMCALGSMILKDHGIAQVLSVVTEEDFASEPNQKIFKAIVHLFQSQIGVDLVTLKNELVRRRQLDQVGGLEYLIQCAELTPSASAASHYAQQVLEFATIRRIKEAGKVIATIPDMEDLTVNDMVSQAVSALQSVSGRTAGSAMQDLASIEVETGRGYGIPTHMPSIDKLLSCYGCPGGQVSLVMAPTGRGKTPFLTQVLFDNWRDGKRVCYATFADLTPKQIKRRLIKLICGFEDDEQARAGGLEAMAAYREALAEVNDRFSDDPNSFRVYNGRESKLAGAIETFSAVILSEHMSRPFDALGVDYLQVLKSALAAKSVRETYDAKMIAGEGLDELAGRLGEKCATIVGSQVTTRNGEVAVRWMTESENNCGLAIRIDREKHESKTVINVVKNRFGMTNVIEDVNFDMRTLRFEDPLAGLD